MPDSLMDQYWRLPPIARTLATYMFFSSLAMHLGLLDMTPFIYSRYYLIRFPPQIWRCITGFLITGPQLGLMFDTYFFYNSCSALETGHPRMRRREDLIWYFFIIIFTMLCFASTTITVPGNEEDYPCASDQSIIRKFRTGGGTGMVGYLMDGLSDYQFAQVVIDYYVAIMPFFTFTHGFIVALTYTATQQQQGLTTNYMFLPIPSPLLPYAMIVISLLFPNGHVDAIQGVYGLVAAHLYEFLSRIYPQLGGGPNVLKTPKFMSRLVNFVESRTRQTVSSGGNAGQASGSASGAGSGPLPDSWKTRGTGQRLG